MHPIMATRARLVSVLALGVMFALATPGAVQGAYPPGSFPGGAPGGTFPTVVFSESVCSGGGTAHFFHGASSLTLTVPPQSFADCRQVTIYGMSADAMKAYLPAGSSLVDGYAVAWVPVGAPSQALQLAVADAAIAGSATVYETTTSGLRAMNAATIEPGLVTVSFSAPLGVVIAGPGSAAPTPSQAVADATNSPPPGTVAPAGSSTGGGQPWPIVAIVALAAAFGVGLVVLRFRRR